MDLTTFVRSKGRGEMVRLHRVSGVAYATIWKLVNSDAKDPFRLKSYASAKKLSAATDGLVSIAELCEFPEKRRSRRSRGHDSDAPGAL